MFKICYILVALSAIAFLPGEPRQESIVVAEETFTIKGNTSLGDFQCKYYMTQKDTLSLGAELGESLGYKIQSDEFGCGNFMLNRDFKKTIKAKDHPYISIFITEIYRKDNVLKCNLKLTLAGVERKYTNLELTCSQKTLKGTFTVDFSDFGLKTPKKMGGIIKVKDKVSLFLELKTI